MKFESKFGVGEICTHGEDIQVKSQSKQPDMFLKVVGVLFHFNGHTEYLCEYADLNGQIHRMHFLEEQLGSDPDFNQETGYSEDQL